MRGRACAGAENGRNFPGIRESDGEDARRHRALWGLSLPSTTGLAKGPLRVKTTFGTALTE